MPYGELGRTTQAGYRPSGQTLVLKFTTGSVARPALQRGAHQYTTHGQGLSALTAAGNGIRQGSGRQLGRQEAAKMRQENVVQAAYVINCEFQGSTRQQILGPRGIRPPPPAHGRMPSQKPYRADPDPWHFGWQRESCSCRVYEKNYRNQC